MNNISSISYTSFPSGSTIVRGSGTLHTIHLDIRYRKGVILITGFILVNNASTDRLTITIPKPEFLPNIDYESIGGYSYTGIGPYKRALDTIYVITYPSSNEIFFYESYITGVPVENTYRELYINTTIII